MRKAIFVLFLGIIISLSSCRKDFDTTPSTGNLQFSKQTVYLDTVFSNISSSTYMLKVYNRSNKDINIPAIRLGKTDSKYRLMVDGMSGVDADNNGIGDGKYFQNVELLAKDSLFIFIETTANIADANPTDFLYTDAIEFASINGTQKVNLVTLIQDAVFLYPAKDDQGNKELLLLGTNAQGEQVYTNGFELNESDPINGNELHFTKDKTYVIYGYAGIPNGKELVIDPGARVHFHAESGLIVQPGGSLKVGEGWTPPSDPEGNPLENEVVFEGDRLEPGFAETPGQWGTVWIRETSQANLNHLTIKNATVGLLVENNDTKITNSQVYNSSNIGILGRTADIIGENLVVNLAGQACFASVSGGTYSFTHCTFNNNWGTPKQVCVSLSNYDYDANGNAIAPTALNQANFRNCIIYGSNNVELIFDSKDGAAFNYDFQNCLIKFNDSGTSLADDPSYNFVRLEQNGNKKNLNPLFKSINTNKLNIYENSPAVGIGNPVYIIPQDILGVNRLSPPDVGAYQSVPGPI